MRKGELLEELDTWKRLLIKDWVEQDEQAYQQIEALIMKTEVTKDIYIIYDIDYMTLKTVNSKRNAEEILNSTPSAKSAVRVFRGVELRAFPMAKRVWEIREKGDENNEGSKEER